VYIGFNVATYASERVQIFGRKNAGVDSTAAQRARCDASRVLATTVGHVTYGRVSVFSLSRERGARADSTCGDRQRAADDSAAGATRVARKTPAPDFSDAGAEFRSSWRLASSAWPASRVAAL